MGPDLILTIDQPKQNFQVAHFEGTFDKAGHAEIKERLDNLVETLSVQMLVFDLGKLKFINSEGIGYLMEIHAHLVQHDKRLILAAPNPHVADVFQTIGIAEIISLESDMARFEK